MNLLIYVTALLLSLSAISYQSLQKFLNTTHSQALWDRELKEENYCRFNNAVNLEYKKLLKGSSANDDDDEDEGDKPEQERHPDSTKGMNFRYFIDEKTIQDNPNERMLYVEVAKRLLEILYGDQPFYKDKLAMRPDLLDAFFEALLESNNGPKKIARVKKMGKLVINDQLLGEFYYAIMKPSTLGKEAEHILSLGKKAADCKTTSFQDYLSEKTAKKIRVFLAPPALLLALFSNKDTVLSILEMRRQLYNDIMTDRKKPEAATQEFTSAFSGYSSFQEILDFSTGRTAPR